MAAIAAALIGAGGWVAYWLLFEQLSVAPPPVVSVPPVDHTPTPAQVERRVTVTAVEGTVERKVGEADWAPLKVGEVLGPADEVRTADGGTATLDVTDLATVEIDAQSRLSVEEITSTLARLRLDEGRVAAVARAPDGARLRFETGGSDAAAEAVKGAFSMLATGDGEIVVATTDGRVLVSARGETVELLPGKQSIVRRGAVPAAPTPIPSSLLLKVKGPAARVQRARSIQVGGHASPGAVVSVNRVTAVVAEDGSFRAVVPLRDGDNHLVAAARDVSGRTRESAIGKVTVKSKIGAAESVIEWGSP